jgi:hypothetical protein
VDANLEIGFALDRRWHLLRGEMESTKKPVLLALARILNEGGAAYAVIGGIAVQVHRREPRTTLDIDLAVLDRAAIPSARLIAAGFRETGRFAHSVNWVGPDGTPVQFTDDPALGAAVARALSIDLDGVPLRVISVGDLLHEKLRAGADPERRRSKRLQDLADAEGLLEDRPALATELRDEERALLERYRR